MTLSTELIVAAVLAFVKKEEAFRAKKYWDFGQWAIGYGEKANHLPDDTVWTEEYASKALANRLLKEAEGVLRLVKVPLTINQAAALTSFNYNTGALAKSTLLKKLNAGDYAGASAQFLRWNKAGRPLKVLAGLTKRRTREKELFLT